MKNRWIVLCGLLIVMFGSVSAQALQSNIAYVDNQVRFTVISEGVIRMEYAPDGNFVNEKSHVAVLREYPSVDFKLKKKGAWVEIVTSKMKLRYKKNSGPVSYTHLTLPTKLEV